MIVLDTNLISELMRLKPDHSVLSWLDEQDSEEIFTTAITSAELKAGIAMMSLGKRRHDLARQVANMLQSDLKGRILAFDDECSKYYADLLAKRKSAGRPIREADCMIAAICQCNKARIATRDAGGFADCGIEVISPWAA